MSRRIDPAWVVLVSLENDQADRCIDLFRRPDGSFGFEEFRRDVEDRGAWTPVQFHSARGFATHAAAMDAALEAVRWLRENQARPAPAGSPPPS